MKQPSIRLIGIFWVLVLVVASTAGTWSTNKFFYEPAMGARGSEEKSNFDNGLERVDAHLGKYKTLGDPNHTTLAEALNTIQDTKVTLTIPSGTISVNNNTTIPANIHLRVLRGANFQVAESATLTINGPLDAGPYPIFSWTGNGAIDLTASPTKEVYLQWWGAQEGTGNDCSAAFEKIEESIGFHQTLRITKGKWRLASPVVMDFDKGFTMKGDGYYDTQIYVDVGSTNVGMTLGAFGARNYPLMIEDISFVGPANCCSHGLKLIETAQTNINRVNFFLGATEYAMWYHGCINARAKGLYVGLETNGYGSFGIPANGILIDSVSAADEPPKGWQSNVVNLDVRIEKGNNGLTVDGTNWRSSVFKLTGIVENANNMPIYLYKLNNFGIYDLYCSDSNAEPITIDSCNFGTINNIYGQQVPNMGLHLKSSHNITINNGLYTIVEIDPDCRGIAIGNIALNAHSATEGGLRDYAPDTLYIGSVVDRDNANSTFPTKFSDSRNLLHNTLLNRWQSSAPDGWVGGGTWVKCGKDLTDCTKHIADYCTRFNTNGNSYRYGTYSLSSGQLAAAMGHQINFTMWMKMASGQNFSNYPYVAIDVCLPTWASNTNYAVGEAVVPTAGPGIFVCVEAGTSGGSEPDWNGSPYDKTADGTITWMHLYKTSNSSQTCVLGSGDVGKWRKLVIDHYIPLNATGASVKFYQWQQSDSSDSEVYWAEPCLMLGRIGPVGFLEGEDEHAEFIFIGGKKISFGSAPPTSGWCDRGDIRFNSEAAPGAPMGWQCSTPGLAGSTAVWKPMGNLAN